MSDPKDNLEAQGEQEKVLGEVLEPEIVDLTLDPNVMSRAVPEFSKLRGAIYDLFNWSETERLWKCSMCRTSLKHHPHWGTSTLNKHFKDKHPGKLEEAKGNSYKEPTKQTTLTSVAVAAKPKPKRITKEGVRAVTAELIVAADLPFNIVEHPAFKNYSDYISGSHSAVIPLVSARTVKSDIEKLYDEQLKELKEEILKNQGKISLITDGWTSPNQISYQGVIGVWIDDNWEEQICVLDLAIVNGSHTGENLANHVGKVINDFQLWDKLMAITTDNASNMDTMFERLDEMAIENGSDFNSKDFRVRCLAHIINLACKVLIATAEDLAGEEDLLDDDEDEEDASFGKGVLKKLRAAIRAMRGSPQRLRAYETACTKENLKHRALLRDVKTRWNSTFDMLVRAKEMKPAMERTLNSLSDLEKYQMNDFDWQIMDPLITMLSPFKETTIVISKNRPTLSDTSGSYQLLFSHLEKYIDEPEPTASTSKRARRSLPIEEYPEWLRRSAEAGWEKLKQYYPSSDALIYILATVVDPRLKLDWYKAMEWPSTWQKQARRSLVNHWEKNYMPAKNIETSTDEHISTSNRSQVSTVGNSFEKMYEERMKSFQKPEDELKQYLSEAVVRNASLPENGVLGWWKANAARFPNLSRMAKDVLSVHGTGVCVERFFSSGPDLLNPKRQRLSAESIRECLSLKAKDLFGDASFEIVLFS